MAFVYHVDVRDVSRGREQVIERAAGGELAIAVVARLLERRRPMPTSAGTAPVTSLA
jgi:hypothetical protein